MPAGEDPEFVRAKFFFRDEFLVSAGGSMNRRRERNIWLFPLQWRNYFFEFHLWDVLIPINHLVFLVSYYFIGASRLCITDIVTGSFWKKVIVWSSDSRVVCVET